MRKKYLAKQNMSLCEDVQNYRFEIVRLNNLLNEKDAKIEELQKMINDNTTDSVDNGESAEIIETDFERNFEEESVIPSVEEITLDGINEYGAGVIGEIVVVSAEYGNKLSESKNTANRDLLNLILGRTEVAKSEILGIVSSERCDEEKKSLMDDVKIRTFEYFDSVMAQI